MIDTKNRMFMKLHLTVPTIIYDTIQDNRDWENIDQIVCELLAEYYGVDLYANKK